MTGVGTPLRLGPVHLRNRVVAAPMERNYCDSDGRPTDHYVRTVGALARGRCALVYAEAAFVRADGQVRPRQLAVDDDSAVPGLRRLADAAHAGGALFGMQLVHGGRLARADVSGHRCVAPSPVRAEVVDGDVPDELEPADITDLVGRFANAARRSVSAGADVISLHAAHGYLLAQFLSPRTNRRTDHYADPARFLADVVAAVRAAVPNTCVGLRVSAYEGVPDGLDTDRTLAVMRRAGAGSLDFIDVSAGCYEAGHLITPPGELPRAVHASAAERFRTLGPPVGVAGRILDGHDADRVIGSGRADFVTVGRALHADPTWTAAVLDGRSPRPCISCNYCADALRTGEPVGCAVNPDAAAPRPTVEGRPPTRSVLVVGAGPAGLEAAYRAAVAGCPTDVVEREHIPGGLMTVVSRLRYKAEYRQLIDWYVERLTEMGAQIHYGTELTAEQIAARPERHIVLATGAVRRLPPIPVTGAAQIHELTAWLRREPAPPPADYVVWGLDRNAVAVADHLAAGGDRVVLVGAEERLAGECGPRSTALSVPRLLDNPRVRIHLGATIDTVVNDIVHVLDDSGRRQVRADRVLVSAPDDVDDALLRAVTSLDPTKTLTAVGGVAGHGRWSATAIRHAATEMSTSRHPFTTRREQ